MSPAARARLATPLLAVAALWSGCARDLDLPQSQPPRIDAVALVGLEAQAVSSDLPVLGGELVVVRGGGFPSSAAEVEVRVGAEAAEVLDLRQDRMVVRVPPLGTRGTVDLLVRTSIGFRTQAGAFRYDGPGQPAGFASSDLETAVKLGFVAPVFPPGARGFSDLAVATGASDSALLLVPSAGYAVATVPLGLVPSSAAAWIDFATTTLHVLAVSRGGGADPLDAALGSVPLVGSSIQARATTRPLSWSVGSPSACAWPLVLATYLGTPLVSWAEGAAASVHKLATLDAAKIEGGALGVADPAFVHTLAGAIAGWGPWGASSVVFAAGPELYSYDAAAPQRSPKVLKLVKDGVPVSVTTLIAPGKDGCPAGVDRITAVATASSGTSEALAVSYSAGGLDRVALVDLGPGAGAGTVRSGITGLVRTSLALAPDPAYASPAGWQVLGTGGTDLLRLRPVPGAPACGDLVPDAALQLSDTRAYLGMGGLATVVDGTRILVVTPDGDLVTVLPPSLTSAGPVVRLASYGAVSVQQATIGTTGTPVVIAEHAAADSAASEIDTGSAVLAVSLAGDRGSVALGGSGYGRGAVWLATSATGGAIAFTGDLRGAGSDGFSRGGAAAVTPIGGPKCPGETIRLGAARKVAGGPDLIVQGPARAGALGPEGVARFGPATPPIYAVSGGALHVLVPDAARIACLVGTGATAPSWTPGAGACVPDASIPLGVQPLDVTLSAGDRVAALRVLDTCVVNTICRIGDEVCLRAQCPPAKRLVLLTPDPAGVTSVAVALPAPPSAVAADRGGGFLVTMPCAAASAGGACFGADPLCAGFGTVPGEENGALALVREDGAGVDCLAVQPGLAGPLAVTPNGAEVWVAGTTATAEYLVRLGLSRRTSDGAVDGGRPAVLLSSERLLVTSTASGRPPAGGVAFTPDGATGVVTVPGQFRIQLRE